MASSRVRAEVAGLLLAIVLGAAAQIAGQEKGGDLQELIAAVEPSVVTIEVPGVGAGSGFVVDADGIVATNFHVIAGATSARVKFQDGSSADAFGFITVSPGRDIALLKIKPTLKLVTLPIAGTRPGKGEPVLAFGAPRGLAGTVSNGIVSALRDGFEISSSMKGVYAALGYDMDANWVQTTAPISHGNSGGPLVNKNGEAIGINTWFRPDGQNLNFAISAVYVQRMLDDAGEVLHPFAELPQPKGGRVETPQDASRATRNCWAEIAESRSSLEQFDGVLFGSLSHLRALRSHAEKIKSLATKGVDLSLLELATIEAQAAERLATAISGGDAAAFASERARIVRINEAYDFLRISLSAKYEQDFPAVASREARRKPGRADTPEAEPAVAADGLLRDPKLHLTRGEVEAAVVAINSVIARYPQTPAAKEAFDLLGPSQVKLVKEMLGGRYNRRLEWSAGVLREVVQKHPGSDAADEAAQLLNQVDRQIRDKQAAAKLHLAKRLIQIGKTQSAIGRLKALIDEFPDTTAAEEAAEMLGELIGKPKD